MHCRWLGIAALLATATALAQPGPATRSTEQTVFFSGEVALPDGSTPAEPVRIQRVCKGVAHDETWTDAKGKFSFKVAAGADSATPDSSQGPRNSDLSRPIGNSTYYSNPVTTALRDCEVQAVLAGYWSDRVNIALKNTLEDTRVGTIILHPVTGAQALAVSATTLAAPPRAVKAYEKGLAVMRDRKWDAAEKEFTKAVTIYPKFAIAWFELGRLRHARHDSSGAFEAWNAALRSDPRYVMPYEGLAVLDEQRQNWVDLEAISGKWIQLDSESFPSAYLYRAIADAQLGKVEDAEAAAKKGLAIDKQHRIPRLSYVLGLIFLQKREFGEAAKCLRTYLELSPNAKDAAGVRAELARIESAGGPPK